MHRLVLAVVSLCAAALLFLLWGDSGEPSIVPPGGRSEVVEQAAPRTVGADAGRSLRASSAAVPEGLFRTEVETSATGAKLTVQVWDREVGVPAEGAEVFVLDRVDERGLDWSFAKGVFGEHWSAIAERHGRRSRTDATGLVDVPNVSGGVVLAARLPGSYAFRRLEAKRDEQATVELTLAVDETVTVRVVGEDGAPRADVAVGILQRANPQSDVESLRARMRDLRVTMDKIQQWIDRNPGAAAEANAKLEAVRSEFGAMRREMAAVDRIGGDRANQAEAGRSFAPHADVLARRQTDERGLAVFEHFQLFRSQPTNKSDAKRAAKAKANAKAAGTPWKPSADHAAFEAALLVPLSAPVTVEFTLDPLPEGVIELRMPPTASLALRTVDRDGRPFTHPVRGAISVVGDDVARWSSVELRKAQNEASIEFAHVGLGLELRARCRLDDEDFRWDAPAFVGPTRPGERMEFDLVVAPDAGMLFAQLVDADGAPMRDATPSLLINAAGGRLEGESLVTDRDGRFHLPYHVRPNQRAPFRFEIRFDEFTPSRGLAIALDELPVATVTDLGRLVVDAFAEIVHGRVLDDVGVPVAGASVQLERERPAGDGELRFADEAFVVTESDDDGRYTLFGDLEAAKYRLSVKARDHFPATPPLAARGSSQDIPLTRKCRVVGTVLAPDWMKRDRLRVDLTPVHVPGAPGGTVEARDDRLHDYEETTYAYFDWVRPGTYDLAFRLQGFPDAFLEVPGLVIDPGQVDVHPRLRDLDLGAYLFRYEIFPVDENGEPVSVNRPQLTKITRANGDEQFIGLVMKGASGEIISTSPQIEVFPMCTGYVAEPQVISAGRAEIVFRSIPPVDIVLPGLSAVAPDINVQVVLERLELDGRPEQLDAFDGMSKRIAGWYARSRYSAGMLDANDTARLEVTSGGPHRVVLRFGVKQTQPATLELDAVQIEVRPGGQPQRLEVPYDFGMAVDAINDVAEQIR